ncbi:hypothetical protein [uncultured Ruminococcus sp.]|nr:hypothetical protein [uncultured Ruminococcus sp.]
MVYWYMRKYHRQSGADLDTGCPEEPPDVRISCCRQCVKSNLAAELPR